MHGWKERSMIYGALALLCGLSGAAAGLAAALLSFAEVVAVVELINCLAGPAAGIHRGADR